MILSIIASKGGTGKTTSSIFLACAAHTADPSLSITLLDADPQQSATDWAKEAKQNKDPLPFMVKYAGESDIENLKDNEGLTIIDTAPGFTDLTQTIIAKSDLCIITTSPTQLDARRAWKTFEAIQRAGGTSAILITRANTRTKDFREMIDDLHSDDANNGILFDTVIRQSTRYSKPFGHTPKKTYDYADAWQEIQKAGE